MKRFNTITTALLVAGTFSYGYAQTLDLRSMATIRRARLEKQNPQTMRRAYAPARGHKAAQAGRPVGDFQPAFITVAPGFGADDLEAAGIEVLSVRGPIAIAEVPVDKAEELSALPCIKAMSLQNNVRPTMDLARADQHVDDILFNAPSAGLPRAYTGRGVVAGIVDQGMDPHHINFRFDNGEPRISYLAWLRASAQGDKMLEDHYNYTQLDQFVTDDANTYHATHTLGILGGSYTGKIQRAIPWADPDVPETTVLEEVDNPYYGVAPQADLVVSCGDLSDVFVAYGMEYLLNYSNYAKSPMVFSLSLGSTLGPRDTRSQLAQFLDIIGREAIICISSGNEGDIKMCMNKTFAEGDTVAKSMIFPYFYQYDPNEEGSRTGRSGQIEVWSDDATPFKLKAVIYNRKRGFLPAFNMPVVGNGIGSYYCSSSDYNVTGTDIVGDPTFVKAYEGYVGVGCKVDEQTGRYYGMVDYYAYNNMTTNLDDNYVLGFEIVGKPGQTIRCYCDGLTTNIDSYGQEGFEDGTTDGSISDMATARNMIVVGSYNTRNRWTCLDGGTSGYLGDGFEIGNVSGFSSYGDVADGRTLPTVCAPGAAIISSVSWPYMKTEGDVWISMACEAKNVEENRVNYWKQEVGTSMSTPYVAGGIALWLEANPTLTIDDVKEIISQTSTIDRELSAEEARRWGAGKFNVLGGLKEAIRRSGAAIEGVETPENNDRLIVTPAGGNSFNLFLGRAPRIDASVYTPAGALACHVAAAGDELTLNLDALAPGIYIVNVNGRHSTKVSVK